MENFTLALGCLFSLLMLVGVQFFVLHGDMLRDVMQSERERERKEYCMKTSISFNSGKAAFRRLNL